MPSAGANPCRRPVVRQSTLIGPKPAATPKPRPNPLRSALSTRPRESASADVPSRGVAPYRRSSLAAMLTFVTAAEASLDDFLSVSAASRYQAQLREYLGSLLRQPCTRPEWCVLGLDGDAPVARAAFWALPGHDVPTDLVLIEADWHDEELSSGKALLGRMHELAGDLGAGPLSHHVDAPPAA